MEEKEEQNDIEKIVSQDMNSRRSGGMWKGLLVGTAASLAGVVLWVIIAAYAGFISGWIGVLMSGAFLWGWNRVNRDDTSKKKYLFCAIIVLADIIVAEFITVWLIASQYGVGLGEITSYPEVQDAMVKDILVGILLTAILTPIIVINMANQRKVQQRQQNGEAAMPGKRYKTSVSVTEPKETVEQYANDYLSSFANKFKQTKYGEENIFIRNVNGAMQCIKIDYVENQVNIEAFVVVANKEFDLTGFAASFVKKPLKRIVDELIAKIGGEKLPA
jgi:hypothetical protein